MTFLSHFSSGFRSSTRPLNMLDDRVERKCTAHHRKTRVRYECHVNGAMPTGSAASTPYSRPLRRCFSKGLGCCHLRIISPLPFTSCLFHGMPLAHYCQSSDATEDERRHALRHALLVVSDDISGDVKMRGRQEITFRRRLTVV